MPLHPPANPETSRPLDTLGREEPKLNELAVAFVRGPFETRGAPKSQARGRKGNVSKRTDLSGRAMYATRNRRILASLAGVGASWFRVAFVALNDIDFFTISDLLDTTEPHHEHIVATLIVLGILLAMAPFLSEWKARRAG